MKSSLTMYYEVQKIKEGTMYFSLGIINNDRYAIVFTRDEDNTLWGKVAYQSVNSIMQCDYDIDWLMPYNKDTGEVDDTEINIESIRDIQWLIDEAERIVKEAED